MPPVLGDEVAESGVLRHGEVVRPVAEDVVHVERGARARGVRGLLGGVGKGQPVAPFRVEVALRARRAGEGGASAALCGELPVRGVGFGAGFEDFVGCGGVG